MTDMSGSKESARSDTDRGVDSIVRNIRSIGDNSIDDIITDDDGKRVEVEVLLCMVIRRRKLLESLWLKGVKLNEKQQDELAKLRWAVEILNKMLSCLLQVPYGKENNNMQKVVKPYLSRNWPSCNGPLVYSPYEPFPSKFSDDEVSLVLEMVSGECFSSIRYVQDICNKIIIDHRIQELLSTRIDSLFTACRVGAALLGLNEYMHLAESNVIARVLKDHPTYDGSKPLEGLNGIGWYAKEALDRLLRSIAHELVMQARSAACSAGFSLHTYTKPVKDGIIWGITRYVWDAIFLFMVRNITAIPSGVEAFLDLTLEVGDYREALVWLNQGLPDLNNRLKLELMAVSQLEHTCRLLLEKDPSDSDLRYVITMCQPWYAGSGVPGIPADAAMPGIPDAIESTWGRIVKDIRSIGGLVSHDEKIEAIATLLRAVVKRRKRLESLWLKGVELNKKQQDDLAKLRSAVVRLHRMRSYLLSHYNHQPSDCECLKFSELCNAPLVCKLYEPFPSKLDDNEVRVVLEDVSKDTFVSAEFVRKLCNKTIDDHYIQELLATPIDSLLDACFVGGALLDINPNADLVKSNVIAMVLKDHPKYDEPEPLKGLSCISWYAEEALKNLLSNILSKLKQAALKAGKYSSSTYTGERDGITQYVWDAFILMIRNTTVPAVSIPVGMKACMKVTVNDGNHSVALAQLSRKLPDLNKLLKLELMALSQLESTCRLLLEQRPSNSSLQYVIDECQPWNVESNSPGIPLVAVPSAPTADTVVPGISATTVPGAPIPPAATVSSISAATAPGTPTAAATVSGTLTADAAPGIPSADTTVPDTSPDAAVPGIPPAGELSRPVPHAFYALADVPWCGEPPRLLTDDEWWRGIPKYARPAR